uniref:THUMP domain-containing protein n=1 Tax=Aegilops tauschii subsp. strangulata TaxID=200361 RepID=A0A453P9K3_AEGTS
NSHCPSEVCAQQTNPHGGARVQARDRNPSTLPRAAAGASSRSRRRPGAAAMGAARCGDQSPALRLPRVRLPPPALALRLPHHLPHQTREKCNQGSHFNSWREAATKKRKIFPEASEIEHSEDTITNGKGDAPESTGSIEVKTNSLHSDTSGNPDRTSNLSLIKLSMSGLLFFSFPTGGVHVVQMLTEVFHSLKSGKLKSPQWCHRIFPIQETCVLSETELHATVSKLFLDFFRNKEDQDEPIKLGTVGEALMKR